MTHGAAQALAPNMQRSGGQGAAMQPTTPKHASALQATHCMQASDSYALGSLQAVCSSDRGWQLAGAARPSRHSFHSVQAEGQPL